MGVDEVGLDGAVDSGGRYLQRALNSRLRRLGLVVELIDERALVGRDQVAQVAVERVGAEVGQLLGQLALADLLKK